MQLYFSNSITMFYSMFYLTTVNVYYIFDNVWLTFVLIFAVLCVFIFVKPWLSESIYLNHLLINCFTLYVSGLNSWLFVSSSCLKPKQDFRSCLWMVLNYFLGTHHIIFIIFDSNLLYILTLSYTKFS